MKKNEFDEKQRQEISKTGEIGFYVMYCMCLAAILIQIIVNGNLEKVIGETFVLVAGSFIYLLGCMKEGIWSRKNQEMTMEQNFFGSVSCSVIFTAFYAMTLSKKDGGDTNIVMHVILFFLGITVLCFLWMTITGKIAHNRNEKTENK